MDGATNTHSGPSTTKITGDRQTSPAPIETVSRPLFSSNYYRKVDRTTDIADRLPNTVYTLPPRLVQAIVGRAELSAATREALVAECKKFFLACREYEESKVVFVDKYYDEITTITLDCGRLYAEGNNRQGQCGIGSEEHDVTGPRLIRLPPVLRVWHRWGSLFANTTRGLYAWGWNYDARLGVGDDDESVMQPRRVLINGDVLNVSLIPRASFFGTDAGWLGCGFNRSGQLGLGHTDDEVTTPTPIPGSEGVTRWGWGYGTIFGFSDDGLLACGTNDYGKCGVGATDKIINTLTPAALPDDVKGRVDRLVCNGFISFFIAGRRCFAAGLNRHGELGLGSDELTIPTPTELPVPVDDTISNERVTIIRSGDTLLACGNNNYRLISADNTPKFTTLTPLDLPGPVVKVVVDRERIFIQLTDGSWAGRGWYDRNYFIPVPKTDLIFNIFGEPVVSGWTPVNDHYADKNLGALNDTESLLVLPEPIANA